MQDLINASDNNFVDVYVPNDYLMKYQVTPLIDALSKVSKKLDVIPFELDDNDNLMEYDIDYDKTLDTYNLCEKFVEGMSIEGATKTKVLSLLKQVYLQNSK
jgi:hypothetical protein